MPATVICDHYEIGEAPRSVGQGRWGPIVRARDMRTKQLVAVKVFDGAAAFRAGTAPSSCSSSFAASEHAQRAFAHSVACLQRLSWDRHESIAAAPSGYSTGEEDAAIDNGDMGLLDSAQLPACPSAVVQLRIYLALLTLAWSSSPLSK